MSKPFYFKQFAVQQDLCAMKVGTDGVLLGAWAKVSKQATHVLDIGTGSGVIAMMLAQRFPQVEVTAIDIEPNAAAQACVNFRNSPFSDRLQVQHIGLKDFATAQKFDAIVTNPPFFTAGILPDEEKRCLARHTAAFSFEMLFAKVRDLLAISGVFSIIAPKSKQGQLLELAKQQGLHLAAYTDVYPTPEKAAKRILIAFSHDENTIITSEDIVIEIQRHHYTADYKRLLKDFYLAF